MHNYYKAGEWNLICDVCGKKIKAGEAKHRWDGFVVCPSDFEYRHEQDFVRARQDKISVPFTRPRPVDVFRLLSALQDTVRLSDDDDRLDEYMEYSIENPYFAEEYIEHLIPFRVAMLWDRGIQDLLSNILETISVDLSTGITDSITITEDIIVVSEFLQSFTDSETVNDSNTISVDKPFVDSSLISDSVSRLLVSMNYTEPNYFESDYVGEYTTF